MGLRKDNHMANLKKRFWEIDLLRGIAIIMMIVFHVLFDLRTFGSYDFALISGFWMWFERVIASTFILLVGVSLTLSFSRAERKANYLKYFKRGLKIFSWGMLITLITWIFFREGFVSFGVLHLIGLSIILAYPFLKLKFWNLGLGAVIIAVGIMLWNNFFNFSWLVWLGFMPYNTYIADYFPVLPWFGVVLVGIFLGNLLYSGYERRFKLLDLSKIPVVKLFCFLGKNSLLIYLIHQPVLIGLLYVLGIVSL